VNDEPLYDNRPRPRADKEAMLVRAVRKVAAASAELKLPEGSRMADWLGAEFHALTYPSEREVVASLGGAIFRATGQDKATIASTLRKAFADGRAAAERKASSHRSPDDRIEV
jgi:hypothetical protein